MILTQFSLYKILFMTELLISEYLFTHRLKHKSYFYLRFFLMIIACYVIAVFFPLAPSNALFIVIIFLFFFAITLVGHCLCYDENFVDIFFCLIAAYIVQHIAYCLNNCMLILTGLNADVFGVYSEDVIAYDLMPAEIVFGYIFTFSVYYIVYYLSFVFFGDRIKRNSSLKLHNFSLLVISALALGVSIVVNSIIIVTTADRSIAVITNVYNSLCCALILYILFRMLTSKKMADELQTVYKMLHDAQKQYVTSKETIELINMKCHDLKHQIIKIGESFEYINKDTLKEMTDIISIYDSEVRTGNEALDIILTEKSLNCYQNKIKLTCIADGKSLSFMSEAELYSLFGNAIDNALSAVNKIQDESKRYIGINVRRVRDFVSINIHNSYEQNLKFDESGLPLTTKKDKINHGFGMKSIAGITHKHNGTLSVVAENGVFNLNIIFPAETEFVL